MRFIGTGVYSGPEAARLTRLRTQRVREWFRGRDSQSRIFKPVFQSDYPVLHEDFAISFLDLIELFIGGKLRDAGISLPKLRRNYNELRRDFGDLPCCTRQIYVSEKQIFTRGLNDEDGKSVIEAITRQHYFEQIIRPFLEKIVYDDVTTRAARWNIAPFVMVDPAIRFGRPTVEGTGIATSTLSRAFHANWEDARYVASWFGVEENQVMAAVNFEGELAA